MPNDAELLHLWDQHKLALLFVGCVVLPALVNGLRAYKNGGGWALLDFLSALVPKDAPGTFKWPLTFSRPPADKVEDKPPHGSAELRALLVIVALAASLAVMGAGCAAAGRAARAGVSCAEAEGVALVHDIAAQAAAILADGSVTDDEARAALAEVEARVGASVLKCAVATVQAAFQAPPAAAPSDAARARAVALQSLRGRAGRLNARAEAYLVQREESPH